MDKINNAILNRIQKEFPLHRTPFKILGELFGLTESETIKIIKTLKDDDKLIRTISPIFEASKLGYKTALIALSIEYQYIANIVDEINKIPGVSHNYKRDNCYNIWFTLAIKEIEDFNDIISPLCVEYNINNYLILPSVRTFKLNTNFNMSENNKVSISGASECCQKCSEYKLDDTDRLVVKTLQNDLPIVSRPFDVLAEDAGLEVIELINRAEMLLANGYIRRYCASIKHLNAGIDYNAMVVWQVDEDLIEVVGKIVSAEIFVSHCYQRVSNPQWPYNLYTMIHARTENQFNDYVSKLDMVINPNLKKILKTLIEYKKTRTMYFV